MTRKSSDISLTRAHLRALAKGRAEGLPFRPGGPGGLMRREDFRPEYIEALRQAGEAAGERWVLSEEEREASRQETLSTLPPGTDLWVFGYGSLMWNPAIHTAETRTAMLYGFHRAFCLSLRFGRGSAEAPGLMLALMPGGACRGLALRIAAKEIECETRILWMREMLAGAYRPRWVHLNFGSGRARGLTFVANPGHERFVGKHPEEETARRIATGRGVLGKNRDYLFHTEVELGRLGIPDPAMARLARRVRALAAAQDTAAG